MPLLLPPDADGTKGKAISGVGNFFGAVVVRTRLQSGGSATKNPVVSEPTRDGEEGGPKDVEFDDVAMVDGAMVSEVFWGGIRREARASSLRPGE